MATQTKLQDPFMMRQGDKVLLNASMPAGNGLPDIWIVLVSRPVDAISTEYIVRSRIGGKENAERFADYHEASINFDNVLWSAVNGQRPKSDVARTPAIEGKDRSYDRQDAGSGVRDTATSSLPRRALSGHDLTD